MPCDSDAATGPRGAAHGRLVPVHGALPVWAEERFATPLEAHRVVTFLNRALKRRGLVFGLSQERDGVRIRIYLTDQQGDDGKDGETAHGHDGEHDGR